MRDPALLADAVVRSPWCRATLSACTLVAVEVLADAGLHANGQFVELPVSRADGFAQAQVSVELHDEVLVRRMRLSTILQVGGFAQHLGVGTLTWDVEPLSTTSQHAVPAGQPLLARQPLVQLEALVRAGSVQELLAHVAHGIEQLTLAQLRASAKQLAADLLLALTR